MRIFILFIAIVYSQLGFSQTFQDGDLIFQHSASVQSTAVQLATDSYYSHCGIVFYLNGEAYVFEAIEPVGVRSLEDWINSGEDQKYAVYRLQNRSLNATELSAMKSYLKTQLEKHYDLGFNWSDKEMYCSELVYKCYLNACQIKLTTPLPLRDFNIDGPIVRKVMKQRYGNEIPYDELMVSPDQLFKSSKLININ